MKFWAAAALLVLAACQKEAIEGDFTGLQLFTTLPTGLGIDRLYITGIDEEGGVAVPRKTDFVTPNDEMETQVHESLLVPLQADLDRHLITFRVDGAKEEGIVASGK